MRLTPAEHAEVARLFRSKLASLREQPVRPRARRPRRTERRIELPADQPAEDELLTTGEVAALLGVTSHTIRRLDLPCRLTLGGQRRYRWGDLRTWLERGV
jgi:Helix-turn-helix domain